MIQLAASVAQLINSYLGQLQEGCCYELSKQTVQEGISGFRVGFVRIQQFSGCGDVGYLEVDSENAFEKYIF